MHRVYVIGVAIKVGGIGRNNASSTGGRENAMHQSRRSAVGLELFFFSFGRRWNSRLLHKERKRKKQVLASQAC